MKTALKSILLPTFIMAAFSFSTNILSPVLSPYIRQLGVSNVQLSLLFSIFPLVVLVFSPIIGHVSDRLGRGRIMLLGVLAEIAALALYLADYSILFLAAARILEALAFISVSLLSLASIEDRLPNPVRSRYSGISLSADDFGVITGSLVGGFLADSFGIRIPFYAAIFVLAALSLICCGKAENPTRKARLSRRDFSLARNLRDFLSVRKLRGMAILGFFVHGKNSAIAVFFPLFMLQALGSSFRDVGIALFLFGGFHLFQFMIGRHMEGKRKEKAIVLGAAVTALATFAFANAGSLYLVFALVLVHSIGAAFWNTAAWSMMSDIGEGRRMEGEVIGSYMSFAKLGSFFSLAINGFVVSLWGFRVLFSLHALLVMGAVVAAAYFFFSKSRV